MYGNLKKKIDIKKEKEKRRCLNRLLKRWMIIFFQSQSYFCQPRRTNERNFRSSLIILMTRRIYENSRIILIRLQALNISVKFSTSKELSDRMKEKKRKKMSIQFAKSDNLWRLALIPILDHSGIALGGAICLV